MEIPEVIKGRRSIRKYTKNPVPEDLVIEILDAGRWAPSAGNSQPWAFIVIRNEQVKKQVAEATTHGKFLGDAPLGIAVVIDPRASNHPVEDGAIAAQNMLLAAYALGLGTCWIGSYNSVYEGKVKEILNIPKDKRLLSIISMGFPAESPTTTRKELREIVFTDRYQDESNKLIARNVSEQKVEIAYGGTCILRTLFSRNDPLKSMLHFDETVVEPGNAVEPHSHSTVEEIWYIIEGNGVVRIDNEERNVGPGDAIYTPPKHTHTIRNNTKKPLRFTSIGARVRKFGPLVWSLNWNS